MEHSARRRPRACPHLAYDGAPVLNSLISRFPTVVLKNQMGARLAAWWKSRHKIGVGEFPQKRRCEPRGSRDYRLFAIYSKSSFSCPSEWSSTHLPAEASCWPWAAN